MGRVRSVVSIAVRFFYRLSGGNISRANLLDTSVTLDALAMKRVFSGFGDNWLGV